MYTTAEENYLKALLSLTHTHGEATVNLLSKKLEIKMPTVNSMSKKLAEKKLVHYESYRPLRLTAKGKKEAALILRKHRLTEMFLVEVMGFGWEEVHPVAEQIEHIQSPQFFAKMDELLNYPKIDPHGSPIPDAAGNISEYPYKPLNQFQESDQLEFVAVSNSSEDFLKYLNKKNLQLGQSFTILSIEPFDHTTKILLEDGSESDLSASACEKILVKK